MSAVNCTARTQRQPGPLGLIVLLRNTAVWADAPDQERVRWNLANLEARTRIERMISARIYQSYGSRRETMDGWAFFSVAEFQDLEAWGDVQRRLEAMSEVGYIEWDVVCFGRRAG